MARATNPSIRTCFLSLGGSNLDPRIHRGRLESAGPSAHDAVTRREARKSLMHFPLAMFSGFAKLRLYSHLNVPFSSGITSGRHTVGCKRTRWLCDKFRYCPPCGPGLSPTEYCPTARDKHGPVFAVPEQDSGVSEPTIWLSIVYSANSEVRVRFNLQKDQYSLAPAFLLVVDKVGYEQPWTAR
ncbi:Pc21g00740 [Penicillium rubens Wisconsin 54-1255]|uniref:Pc21g00740 protein n=1 Tax=Penicillium rubens (strain ATCC 28089 / DSM 1075 / NRRL 1951 / Wisconsin 54-1255) TaxID=500485 RepID=B6HHF7_PENRW|nr:Pc21g00740 [Penicillium rubens Wisconsin 54-1255]